MAAVIIVILIAIIIFLLWVIKNLSESLKSKRNQISKKSGIVNEAKMKAENDGLKIEIRNLRSQLGSLQSSSSNEETLKNEIRKLNEKIKKFESNRNDGEKEKFEQQIKILNSEKENLKNEADKKEKNLTLKIDELEKELNQEKQKSKEVVKNSSSNGNFNNNFEKIFDDFKKISENEKKRIEVIITEKKGKEVFLGLGLQASNLKLLWEQIEFNIQKNENPKDTEILIETYYYFFELYNLLFSAPVYTFLDNKIGDRYNPITSIPVNTGYTKNEIKKVVFKGYKNRKGDIVKQSLVVLD